MAAEVVHDDHIAWLQLRHEHLVDIGLEGIAVDRAVEDHRGGDPVEAQAGHEGGRLPMPVRNAGTGSVDRIVLRDAALDITLLIDAESATDAVDYPGRVQTTFSLGGRT